MRYWMLVIMLVPLVHADYINSMTLGCPTIELHKNFPTEAENDYIKLSQYAAKTNCIVFSPQSNVEALGDNVAYGKSKYVQVVDNRTGQTLWVLRKFLVIEQPGNKNTMRFKGF